MDLSKMNGLPPGARLLGAPATVPQVTEERIWHQVTWVVAEYQGNPCLVFVRGDVSHVIPFSDVKLAELHSRIGSALEERMADG